MLPGYMLDLEVLFLRVPNFRLNVWIANVNCFRSFVLRTSHNLTNLIYELRRFIMPNTTNEANDETLVLLHGDHQYEVPNNISRQVVADVLVAGGVSREHGFASSGRSWQWLKDVSTMEEKCVLASTIQVALIKAGFRFLESSRDQPLLHIQHSVMFLTYPESNCGTKNEGRCGHTIAYLSVRENNYTKSSNNEESKVAVIRDLYRPWG